MSQYLTEVTAISSKGQVVLPKNVRDSLVLVPGAKLMVLSDGENILLKPIKKPDISEFRAMMNKAAEWAREVGMTEDDITDAIATVRQRRKATK